MDKKFFDNLSVTLTRTAKEVGEKAESFYGKQKMRAQIMTEEHAAEKALAALGSVIYKRAEAGEEFDEELKTLCENVKICYEKIEAMKKEMADKEGKKKCPSCGAMMDRDAVFCSSCGNAYPETAEEMEEEETEEAVEETAEEPMDDAEAVKEAVEEILTGETDTEA